MREPFKGRGSLAAFVSTTFRERRVRSLCAQSRKPGSPCRRTRRCRSSTRGPIANAPWYSWDPPTSVGTNCGRSSWKTRKDSQPQCHVSIAPNTDPILGVDRFRYVTKPGVASAVLRGCAPACANEAERETMCSCTIARPRQALLTVHCRESEPASCGFCFPAAHRCSVRSALSTDSPAPSNTSKSTNIAAHLEADNE